MRSLVTIKVEFLVPSMMRLAKCFELDVDRWRPGADRPANHDEWVCLNGCQCEWELLISYRNTLGGLFGGGNLSELFAEFETQHDCHCNPFCQAYGIVNEFDVASFKLKVSSMDRLHATYCSPSGSCPYR